MNDPVSQELAGRANERWPWRWALAISLGLHVATGVGLLRATSSPRRPTTLPSVQVRLAALPMPAAAAGPAAVPATRPAAPAPAPQRAAPPPARPAPQRPPAEPQERAAVRPTSVPVQPEPAPESAGAGQEPPAAGQPTQAGAAAGALTLGPGGRGGGTDEVFPYEYYLQRLLSLIESNWFRPPAPEGTRCRVRARLDRSGRLLEAGLSEESGVPSFDRAALRAVFAAAPFPPLPQGFSGATLTVHLEFGQ